MQTELEKYAPHILCIIPLFAPAALAEAFCGTKMVQALMNRGASVTVLSSGNLWSGVPADSSGIWESVRNVNVDVPVSARRNPLHAILTAPRFQTPFNGRWLTSVLRTAKRLDRERKFDLVYTRSLPMVSHIAGFWCARELKLPWIANINDPWGFHFFLEAARSNWILRRLRKLMRHIRSFQRFSVMSNCSGSKGPYELRIWSPTRVKVFTTFTQTVRD